MSNDLLVRTGQADPIVFTSHHKEGICFNTHHNASKSIIKTSLR